MNVLSFHQTDTKVLSRSRGVKHKGSCIGDEDWLTRVRHSRRLNKFWSEVFHRDNLTNSAIKWEEKKKKHSKKTAEFVYAGWWGQHWAAWQKYVYIHCRTSLAQLFFSCVRGQSSQGMFPFSAVRFTARKLILWAEGYPSAFSNPTSQTETRCICAHIFSLFWSKNSKGWSEQSLLRGKSVQTSLKESRAFPSSSSSFSPACVLLTKTADRRLRINSMEPADESKEEKESRGRQRSCIKTPPGKNNTWLLAGLTPEESMCELEPFRPDFRLTWVEKWSYLQICHQSESVCC